MRVNRDFHTVGKEHFAISKLFGGKFYKQMKKIQSEMPKNLEAKSEVLLF